MASPQITLKDPGEWLRNSGRAAPASVAPTDPGEWLAKQNQPAPEAPGFLEKAWGYINPTPQVREWLNRPKAHRDIAEAFITQMKARKENRALTPEEEAIVERGMQANVHLPEGNILADAAGPGADAATEASKGNYAGAAGALVGGYGVPLALGAGISKLPAAIESAAPVARAAVKAAAPDVGMGLAKVAGGAALSELPLPGPVKYVAGAAPVLSGVRQMGRGVRAGWQAGKAAIADRVAAAAAQASAPEPPPQLTGTALRSSGPIAPGPVPIGLGMPQPEAAPIPLRPAVAVTPGEAFARSQGIDWASMSPTDKATKATLENVARAHANVQAQPAAVPPPNPAPPPVIPQAPPEVPQPVPQPIQAAPPVQTAPEPPPAPAEQPAPSVAQQLRDSLMPESKAAPGEVATIAPTEPEFPSKVYEDRARAGKIEHLAKALHENGISHEDALNMPIGGENSWATLAKAIGENAPSKESIHHTLFELKKLEKAAKPATPARAEQSAVTVPGPNGTSNGKVSITDASRALAEEMQRSGTLEAPRLKTARRAKQ